MLRNTDVEGPIFCPILTKFELSRQINVKVYNTKLHGNKSSRRSADRCWYTYEQTDMTKVTGTHGEYANAPRNWSSLLG